MQEIVITVAASGLGAQIQAVTLDSEAPLSFDSDPIGRGNRWRHVLAFGAFGPAGEMELVEVVTPHIGGIVQFHRFEAASGRLETSARISGYTTHAYGSPNLDEVIAGDFNGDRQLELVLTTQDRTRLVGMQHSETGSLSKAWSLPLDAPPVTNFVGMALPEGGMALVIGLADGALRVWLPDG